MNTIYSLFKKEGISPRVIDKFRYEVWRYYHEHGRVFPWRETQDPYAVLVSEVMLQQTQTSRVTEKYV
jgi:A/G-specific adenine glycosylase